VMQQVTVLFDGEVTAMRQGQCGEANDARKVGLYLMKRLYYLT